MRHLAYLVGLLLFVANAGSALADGQTYGLFTYWHDGRQLSWYNFGARSATKDGRVATQPVYVLYSSLNSDGTPVTIPGQGSIFESKPGDPGYTDLWQQTLVKAPAGYQANTITSSAQIRSVGLALTSTKILLDCPIVDPTDQLVGGEKPRAGWVAGQPVSYFDIGPVSDAIGQEWLFTNSNDAKGQPVRVPGQLTVSDSVATAFRQVNWVTVPANYQANTITTVAQLKASGYSIAGTSTVNNVPLPKALPAAGPGTASYVLIGLFSAAFLISAAFLLRQPSPAPALSAAA